MASPSTLRLFIQVAKYVGGSLGKIIRGYNSERPTKSDPGGAWVFLPARLPQASWSGHGDPTPGI